MSCVAHSPYLICDDCPPERRQRLENELSAERSDEVLHMQVRPTKTLCGIDHGPFNLTIRSDKVTCSLCRALLS